MAPSCTLSHDDPSQDLPGPGRKRHSVQVTLKTLAKGLWPLCDCLNRPGHEQPDSSAAVNRKARH